MSAKGGGVYPFGGQNPPKVFESFPYSKGNISFALDRYTFIQGL